VRRLHGAGDHDRGLGVAAERAAQHLRQPRVLVGHVGRALVEPRDALLEREQAGVDPDGLLELRARGAGLLELLAAAEVGEAERTGGLDAGGQGLREVQEQKRVRPATRPAG
jgi:hypothetical protein